MKWNHVVLCFALALAPLSAGCTQGPVGPVIPDAQFLFDTGIEAGAVDAGFPDPVVDTCVDAGGTIGDTCTTTPDCQDGCFCNGNEQCMGGTCVAGTDPCPDTVDCTVDGCLEETNTCFHMLNHGMCSDDLACNGYEVCDPAVGCRAAPPLVCNDETACTVDECDDTMGCVFTARDLDGDGYVSGSCGGEDCDDDPRFGTLVFPGAPEVCDNRRDDDCNGRRDYSDSTCVPTNDACDSASILRLGPTGGTFSGSSTGLRSDYTLSCASGSSGADSVFRFHLDATRDTRVTVSGASGTAVALRPFPLCSAGPDDKCNAQTPASFIRRSLPAGDWALIVRTGTPGPFDVRIELSDPTAIPPVDRCAPGTTDVSAGGTFMGAFEETSDDYTLSCHSTGFLDAAYTFTIPAGVTRDVVVTGTTTSATGTAAPYLAITSDCASSAATVVCTTPSSSMLRRRSLGPGTYYILVEASDAAARTWTINVTITDPAPRAVGDACSSAIEITPPSGMTTGMGSTTLSTLEYDVGTSCGAATGARDAYFHFHTDALQDVSVTTSAGGGSHSQAVSTECGVRAAELRCRTNTGSYSQTFRSLPAGDYWITVQTTAGAGVVSASIVIRPPTTVPMNETCAGPTALAYPTDSRPLDTLTAFVDDLAGGSCGATGMVDAFYQFTLPVTRHVILSATTVPAGSRRIVVTVRGACGPGIDLMCNSGMGSATTPSTLLDPGTYYVFVEMAEADAGDFRLDFATLP